MSKYDKMLALNKKASDEKIERARKAIFDLMDEKEKVTVPKLMEKTGLSRGFFYKNPQVRQAVDRAVEQQVGMNHPRKNILDMAMNSEIAALHKQLKILQNEKEELEKDNEKLRKALERKNRELLRNL
ncbi:DUF6262 family protein [Eisenbergiella tayi]|uniref:DUF6262 family protein n=1 Tax=Eisenbergiella tayi TaxID=1432052 RepID=UPI000848C573|nr:DUF6262 family protein [Eisenbergiella tayi]ODR28280.1 hypothetical protein BEI60_31100 [Eisenbergiella tayi]